MGEQPVFTTRAHVFQINPTTKKSWIPCCGQPVPVSFYYDPARHTHRIISVDGSKALVNSTITANMTFTKTSQKFGQWSDPKANTIFGLGFAGEADINKFEEKFKEAKATARMQSTGSVHSSAASITSSPQSPNRPIAPSVNNHIMPTSKSMNSSISESSMSTPPSQRSMGRSSSSTSSQETHFNHTTEIDGYGLSISDQYNSDTDGPWCQNILSPNFTQTLPRPKSPRRMDAGSPVSPRKQTTVNSIDSQLKYENDKLKAALAQSSANAKKWENELQTLKNNNARLTAALQESTSNVEEWKKQLNAYKEENTRLREKVQDMENSKVSDDQLNQLKKEKQELAKKVGELENHLQEKDQEINKLSQQQLEINNLKMKIADLSMQQQETENERQKLQEKNDDLQIKVDAAHLHNDNLGQLRNIQGEVGQKITELHHLHEQMIDKLQT